MEDNVYLAEYLLLFQKVVYRLLMTVGWGWVTTPVSRDTTFDGASIRCSPRLPPKPAWYQEGRHEGGAI